MTENVISAKLLSASYNYAFKIYIYTTFLSIKKKTFWNLHSHCIDYEKYDLVGLVRCTLVKSIHIS
jgi:hypothetical protein